MNLRGSLISASIPATSMASASLSIAFRVTISRSLSRRGLTSASRTACKPKSQTVSAAAAFLDCSLATTHFGFLTITAPVIALQKTLPLDGIFLLTPQGGNCNHPLTPRAGSLAKVGDRPQGE